MSPAYALIADIPVPFVFVYGRYAVFHMGNAESSMQY